jgi:predicted  nucleic acid-binding Zn-ribbon protein
VEKTLRDLMPAPRVDVLKPGIDGPERARTDQTQGGTEAVANGQPSQDEFQGQPQDDEEAGLRKQRMKRKFETIDEQLNEMDKRLRSLEEHVSNDADLIDDLKDIPAVIDDFTSDIQFLKTRLFKLRTNISDRPSAGFSPTVADEVMGEIQRLKEDHAREKAEWQTQFKVVSEKVDGYRREIDDLKAVIGRNTMSLPRPAMYP